MGYLEDISERIKLIKKELAKDNNCEFARITGESEAKIRSYIRINEKPAMPSAEFIAKVIEKFELNHEWMLYGRGNMKGDFENTTSVNEITEPPGSYSPLSYLERTVYSQNLQINELGRKLEEKNLLIQKLLTSKKNDTAEGA